MAYLGVQPLKGQNRTIDNISASFNGSNVTFNLTSGSFSLTPATAYQLFISVGGVLQSPGVDFTVSGNQITFTTAPAAGLSFWGLYQGDAIDSVSVSDGSITTAKLATGLTVTLGAGAVGTPSLTFAGDTNTGIYSPAADTIAFVEGGVEALRIDSSARVGIGTSAPQVLTHLSTSTDTQLRVESTSASGTNEAALQLIRGSNQSAIKNKAGGIEFFVQGLTNEIARFDSSGRLGIGTTGPTNSLEVVGGATGNLFAVKVSSGGDCLAVTARAAGNGAIVSALNSAQSDYEPFELNGEFIYFQTRTGAGTVSERARIDSSGRLLVGTSTALGDSNSRFQVVHTGPADIYIGRSDGDGTSGNRLGSLVFQSFAGSSWQTAASIVAEQDAASGANDKPGRLVFSVTADGASSPTEAVRISQNRVTQFQNDIIPGADNAYQVGQSGRRWSVVFAGTGTINTSDANLKQDIEALEQAELNVAAAIKGLVKKFRFIDAVEAKGGAARIHIGVIAQEVEQAFIDEGLDPRRYAMFCEDTVEDGSKRLGIRYDELLAFVIAAL